MTTKIKELPTEAGGLTPTEQLNNYVVGTLVKNRQWRAAISATKRMIEVTPTSKELWVNLASYFVALREFGEAEACCKRALMIDPNFTIAHDNLGVVYAATKQWDLAEQSYQNAIAVKPDNLSPVWNSSLSLLRVGNYEEGFKRYEKRIPFKPHAYRKFPAPYYDGSGELKNKTIYLVSEQGMGDTILFSRFLPWLADQGPAKIYMCVNPDMTNLLWGFRHIVEFIPEGVPIPEADYTITMGSLPHFAGLKSFTDIPDDPGKIAWRCQLSAKNETPSLPVPGWEKPFKVGINWSGNPAMDRNEERSIPLHVLARVIENPHAWAYSFQVGESAKQLAEQGYSQTICDLSPMLTSGGLVRCGAAMLQMDLIITCCSMTAHLAGALGIPCWVMLCYDAYWPWAVDRSDSPWYPSVKLFRQTVPDNWVWVMNDVIKELNALISKRN